MNNVIFIDFYDKKGLPPGKWHNEPDFCYWERKLPCLVVRDMGTGLWRGFVGINEDHPYYGKSLEELIRIPGATDIYLSVYGGISAAGRLPPKFKEFSKNYWWVSIETCHGGDLVPMLRPEDMSDSNDPNVAKALVSSQTYKDMKFIRNEVNKLSSLLSKVK
jgi:hypothetical protein